MEMDDVEVICQPPHVMHEHDVACEMIADAGEPKRLRTGRHELRSRRGISARE